MNKSVLLPNDSVDVTGCLRCSHYADAGLFQLCRHEQSAYVVGAVQSHHTVQHMRGGGGLCGLERRLATWV